MYVEKGSQYEGSDTESDAEYQDGGGETVIEQTEKKEEVKKAKSAYNFHSLEQFPILKESFIAEGLDSSMGGITSALSAKWRSMDKEQRSPYEKLAADDSVRYSNERFLLDEKFRVDQEERRQKNDITGFTGSRMRNSTVQSSSTATEKVTVKRKRVESKLQKKDKETRRRVRKVETDAIEEQLEDLRVQRAAQAEARLKYLLSQSDIFAHFGAGQKHKSKQDKQQAAKNASKSSSSATRSPGQRRVEPNSNIDEDEAAMMAEEGEDGDGASGNVGYETLAAQPSIVSGGQMRLYQLEGLNWIIRLMQNGINGILADEMGLGKTLQSISVLAYLRQFQGIDGPHLVMVPKSTMSNWMNEFKRWCPSIRVLKFHGTKDERASIVANHMKPVTDHSKRDWDVVVTTYEIMNMEKMPLGKIAWHFLIIDEAHRLKNEMSMFAQNIRALETKNRLLLTGTPLQNNLHELWALLNFILPDVFSSSEQFDDWFNLDVDDEQSKRRMIGQLHKLLRPFMLRRLKADVEKSLPPKTETILFIPLSGVQKQLYKQILLRDLDVLNSSNRDKNENSGRTAILNIVMQLRKCCNHPYLFPNVEDRTLNPLGEHLYENCGKMVLLHKLLKKLKARDNRVLIFSQMTRMMDILEDYLLSQGYLYCRIDGNTTYDEREDRIAEYNKPGSTKFIFLLSTRAGGLGINLQTADTVILYDSDWNPQADLQAQDRAHRIGQKKVVQVFRFVTEDTIEVKVVERAQQKLKLDAMVVQQGRLQEKEKKMSKSDLLDSLRFGADKIFKSKDQQITDADIDSILDEGRKKTDEMLNSNLQASDKGDMYDFRLDGSINTQEYEGVNYALSENQSGHDGAVDLNSLTMLALMEPTAKRERKSVNAYSDSSGLVDFEDTLKRVKQPRALRLIRMEDWHFYNRERITEIYNEEVRVFNLKADAGEIPNAVVVGYANNTLGLISDEVIAEKKRLLDEGFGDWTRTQYSVFVRASAKYGRNEFGKIAKEVVRNKHDVERYAATFWSEGYESFGQKEMELKVAQIEKGEKRLEEISKLNLAASEVVSRFEDPWEDLKFHWGLHQARNYNTLEDRFLLCLTSMYGHGEWDEVRKWVRRSETFRFDFFMQCCNDDTLGRRCEKLMKAALLELQEIEIRKAEANASELIGSQSTTTVGVVDFSQLSSVVSPVAIVNTSTWEDPNLSRLANLVFDIKGVVKEMTMQRQPAIEAENKQSAKSIEVAAAGDIVHVVDSIASVYIPQSKTMGGRPQKVPDGVLPELCKLLVNSGMAGVNVLASRFSQGKKNMSKRQVEIKINELAVKEKMAGDTAKVWHIRPQFHYLLGVDNYDESDPAAVSLVRQMEMKSQIILEKQRCLGLTLSNKPKSGRGRKKKDPFADSIELQDLQEPARPKSRFQYFSADRARMITSHSHSVDVLKCLLIKAWDEEVDKNTKEAYKKMEEDDKSRYEIDMHAYGALRAELEAKEAERKEEELATIASSTIRSR